MSWGTGNNGKLSTLLFRATITVLATTNLAENSILGGKRWSGIRVVDTLRFAIGHMPVKIIHYNCNNTLGLYVN